MALGSSPPAMTTSSGSGDATSGAQLATLSGHTSYVRGCAVSPDGSWIVSAGGFMDHTLRIWDVATGTERATLIGHLKVVNACAISPDSTLIVSASDDGTLKIWDASTGAERVTLRGHTGSVRSVAVSPDGSWIVSACDDGTLNVWDVATGIERAILVLPGAATAVAFHPFAPMVVCGDTGGGVHLAHLVGIDLGPLVITTTALDNELWGHCPACQHRFQIVKERLGSEITCPKEGCNTRLRVNSFVIRPIAQNEDSVVVQPPEQGAYSAVIQKPEQGEIPVVIQPPAPRKKNWLSRLLRK